MNGRGVFSSKKMGRLIVTFEPRLVRIFPVRVLSHGENEYDRYTMESTYGNLTCGFVISSGRNKLWLEIASFGSKYGSVKAPWTPRRGNEVKVRGISFDLRCFRASVRLVLVEQTFCASMDGKGRPVAHVALYRKQVGDGARVGGSRCRFEHEAAILWVEGWYDDARRDK